MANVCAIPIRYSAGAEADPRLVQAVEALADALEGSDEFQAFVCLARDVNDNAQVADMLEQIRERHAQYSQSQNGDLIVALESLPVMLAYRQSETALRELCAQVDRLISAESGMTFSLTVRPQGHG